MDSLWVSDWCSYSTNLLFVPLFPDPGLCPYLSLLLSANLTSVRSGHSPVRPWEGKPSRLAALLP